jgi:hypothetical protein
MCPCIIVTICFLCAKEIFLYLCIAASELFGWSHVLWIVAASPDSLLLRHEAKSFHHQLTYVFTEFCRHTSWSLIVPV